MLYPINSDTMKKEHSHEVSRQKRRLRRDWRTGPALAGALALIASTSATAGPGAPAAVSKDPPRSVVATPSHGVSSSWRYPAVTMDETLPEVGKGVGDNIAADGERIYTVFTSSGDLHPAGLYFLISGDAGDTWSDPQRFPLASEEAALGSLCMDSSDRLHFVWLDTVESSSKRVVCYAFSDDGAATWRGSQVVSPAKDVRYGAQAPQVSADLLRAVHVAWYDGSSSSTPSPGEVWYANSLNRGRDWEAPVRLSADDGFISAYPRMDFSAVSNPDHDLVIPWRDNSRDSGAAWSIQFARSSDRGKTWCRSVYEGVDAAGKATTTPDTWDWDPDVLIDPDGRVHLGVMRRNLTATGADPRYDIFYTRSFDGGLTFEPEVKMFDDQCRFMHILFDRTYDRLFFQSKYDGVPSGTPRSGGADLIGRSSDDYGSTWAAAKFATEEFDDDVGMHGLAAQGGVLHLTYLYRDEADSGRTWRPKYTAQSR